MVVLSLPVPPEGLISHYKSLKFLPTTKIIHTTASLRGAQIPTIDLSSPNPGPLIVNACRDLGFFKVTNHGVPSDLISKLEDLSFKFFSLPQFLKEKASASASSPMGYGNKNIGLNGDVGWLEFLLFSSSSDFVSAFSTSVLPQNPTKFSGVVKSYISEVKKMSCRLLEEMAKELKMDQNDAFSKLLKDENSDSCFRVNHYPPYTSDVEADLKGEKLVGFGEHTDPQIISVLRSNDASGFEILTKAGDWVAVPPDNKAYFVIVGDALQVMTNGRFRSVKHRAVAEGKRSRLSMIYFGGPPPSEKIAPLPSLMGEGEESLYKEFTWCEFKKAVYKTRLADHRLGPFEKTSILRR